MAILTLTNLGKRFSNGQNFALQDISVEIDKGELVSLVGESGSGKTTLLRLIAGFETPSAGSVEINGQPMVDDHCFVSPEARGVGMVFQGCALFPHLNIRQNIAFGLSRLSKAARTARVDELFELIGLSGFHKRFPHELSGGEQQRVALARALAPKPALILLDEPFSNLDESLKSRMRCEVKAILTQTGTTAVLVTHDTEDALAISKRIAILKDGRMQQIGTPEVIYSQPANRYVANLFGNTNVIDSADLKPEVRTAVERTLVDDNKTNAQHFLAIRPENFTVVEQCTGSICAEVREVVFQGSHKELLLAAKGPNGTTFSLTVHVQPAYRVAPNDRVHVRPKRGKIHPICR